MRNGKRPAARPATAQRRARLLLSPEFASEIEKCDEIASKSGSGIEIEIEPPPHPPQQLRTQPAPQDVKSDDFAIERGIELETECPVERTAHRQHCCST